MAATVGDPHMERLDGMRYDFTGQANATYDLLTHDGLVVHAAISGSGRVWHWGRIILPAGGTLFLDEKGLTRIAAGGWLIDVWRLVTEEGEPHLNVHFLERPADTSSATGLLVSGTADADPAGYLVSTPPG